MEKDIKRSFDAYISLLTNRHVHNKSLSWLFDEYPDDYFPDYLTLGSFGPTPTEKFLNATASSISPFMWKHVAWPKILDTIHRRFLVPYADFMIEHAEKTNPSSANRFAQKQAYLSTLYDTLAAAPPQIRHSGFTDFFYFTSKTLDAWSRTHGLSLNCFESHKQQHLAACHNMYKTIHQDVNQHPKRLLLILLLCVRANWIDCSEEKVDEFLRLFLADIEAYLDDDETLSYFESVHPYFDIGPFQNFLNEKKRTIMYEMDNCGECFFDFLLIEWLLEHGHTVKLSVKHGPFLNDVTLEDIESIFHQYDVDKLTTYLNSHQLSIVNSGARVAGKYVYDVSKTYKKEVTTCDLQILKGQGHFQTMPIGRTKGLKPWQMTRNKGQFKPFRYKRALFFMMGVKADLIDYSLQTMFSKSPERHSVYVYFFDPKNKHTFPT